MKYSSSFLVLVGLSSVCMGCTEKKDPPPAPMPAKTPAPAPAVPQEEEEKSRMQLPPGHIYSVGPQLIFVPGKGAGAIRFGATVETIERLMEAPCDKKTEERCLYSRHAVEFFLKDGVLSRVKAHRRDRKVTDPAPGKDEYFGTLSGLVLPTILLGLHRHVVLEEFGEPSKKEAISPPGPDGLVDRHYYDGIVFEYDQIANGNIVLAAIEVVPSKTPYVPPLKVSTPAEKGASQSKVVR
jgi:hypothetical protein